MNPSNYEVIFPRDSGFEQNFTYVPDTTVGEPAHSSKEIGSYPDTGIIVVGAIVIGFYGLAKLIISSNTFQDR